MTFRDLARRFAPARPEAAPEASAPPPPPPPPAPTATAFVAGRVEYNGLMWHPVVGVAEEARLVVSAKAGLPHCRDCDKPLTLARDWSCPACGREAPGSDADFYSMDHVTVEWLAEFLREHPDHAPAPGLPVRAPVAA